MDWDMGKVWEGTLSFWHLLRPLRQSGLDSLCLDRREARGVGKSGIYEYEM